METEDTRSSPLSGPVRTPGQDGQLAAEGQWWLRERNVEAVFCWLPTFDQVCDGVHTIAALGNDNVGVSIVVDSEEAARAAGRGGEQVQLAFLGRFLSQIRRQELMPHERR